MNDEWSNKHLYIIYGIDRFASIFIIMVRAILILHEFFSVVYVSPAVG